MRITAYLASACLILFGTIAAAQNVTYDYDPTVNFSAYRTFAWTRGTELSDEFNHARVVRAIETALAAKGLTCVERETNPDLLVAYHASFEQNLEINGVPTGWGPPVWADRWGSARVQPILVGTLLVDMRDARTNGLVWRSLASSDVARTDKPEARDKKIAKAAQKMFKNYPPASR